MYVNATAQPIHADGTVGFDSRNPLHVSGTGLREVMSDLGLAMEAYPAVDAWDVTVTIEP